MKTLFLNPPSFDRFDSAGARFAATRKTRSLWYPAWLGYAAALVPNSQLIDSPATNTTLDHLLKIIKKFDLIVIYTSTPSINNDLQVAQSLKKTHPQAKIVFTGPHVSVLDKQTLKSSPAIMAVARQEFDYTILELSQKKPLSKIKGLTYRKGSQIIRNPNRPPVHNLDKLGFVSKVYQRDLPINRYHLPFCLHPYLAIYAGRGCPARCIFCLWPQTFTGRIYRKRSVKNVIKEINWIKKNLPQIKEIFFDDDTFTINQSWVKEFCQAIKPLHITWSVNARANLPYNLLKTMKDAGCRYLIVGYESGNQQILKTMQKGVTLEQMKKFTHHAHQAGLMTHGDFILGLPGETKQTINQTLKFAKSLDCDTIQVSIATAFPGTELYSLCQKKGYLTKPASVDKKGYQLPTISYPKLSSKDIYHAVENFHYKFYFRPRYILKTFKTALKSPAEAKRILLSSLEYFKYLITSK